MTAYVASLGAAVALALIVDAAVRAREERLWRRDQEQAMARLAHRRADRDAQMVAGVLAEAERATRLAGECEAVFALPCAAEREART